MKTLPCPGSMHLDHRAPLRPRGGRLLLLALLWVGGCLSAPAPIPAGGDETDSVSPPVLEDTPEPRQDSGSTTGPPEADTVGGGGEVPMNEPDSVPLGPTAVIQAEESGEVIPQTVLHLHGDQSYAAHGTVARWEWSVDQPPGSQSTFIPSNSVPDPTFEVNVAGTYTFHLVVYDEQDVPSAMPAVLAVMVILGPGQGTQGMSVGTGRPGWWFTLVDRANQLEPAGTATTDRYLNRDPIATVTQLPQADIAPPTSPFASRSTAFKGECAWGFHNICCCGAVLEGGAEPKLGPREPVSAGAATRSRGAGKEEALRRLVTRPAGKDGTGRH